MNAIVTQPTADRSTEDSQADSGGAGVATDHTSTVDLAPLVTLVRRLCAPDGCPWDRAQTLPDLRAYLLEEAHEVAAAIDARDATSLMAELGDLQFQIVFLSHLAAPAAWDRPVGDSEATVPTGDTLSSAVATQSHKDGTAFLAAVLDGIHHKMVSRHPHVFGASSERLADADAVRGAWERRKLRDKDPDLSLLDGVAASVPALLAAYRLTQKAAGVGFDWPNAGAVLAKVHEELAELEHELVPADEDPPELLRARRREELGDLLFAIANLARHLDIDPEAALAGANMKFRRRFRHIERRLGESGKRLDQANLEEMDALWDEAKTAERLSSGTPTSATSDKSELADTPASIPPGPAAR